MAEKKEEKGWVVGLTITDEEKPPKKVFQNSDTEETLDEYGMMAYIANSLDKLQKLL